MSWNKGFTKFTHSGVKKISETMKKRKIDNFKDWRARMKKMGKIPSNYPPLHKSRELAEYIGVILGDGNITKFERTEGLTISANSNNLGFIIRYQKLTYKIFHKHPSVIKVPDKNNTRIRLYQKELSKRLSIPTGNRKEYNFIIPTWIKNEKFRLISLLRGLFEAEGSLSIHLPTCTYNFQFSNKNKSLLNAVEFSLRTFGYHPERRINSVRLRRKAEVEKFRKLIKFREY